MMYQKEDVLPYMKGMWRDALQSICGLHNDVFNKKHQPCPHCGGKDRFRWTDKLNTDGDGGAICNACGNDSGIGWMMKLTGEPYSEVINILGRFLGKVPQEYVIKANKRASRSSGYSFGAQAPHESCVSVMERTIKADRTPLSTFEGIFPPDDESYSVGVKNAGTQQEELIHAIPCVLVHDDGLDDEMCNILFIDSEATQSFYAKDYTRGSVAVTGKTDKTIYLCVDWIDAQHTHLSTGQEVWTCFSQYNLEMVAHRYKGPRQMRVVCRTTDRDVLITAEERGLDVMIPIDNNFKRGIERKLYKPESLL
nr:MAG TPA: primase helicase [Caudoviricetes sp.]